MSTNSDSTDIGLDKLKNILIAFEKKKRNLEKRKNKLDEYRKKADLNDDQQVAVAKYPEVMSNIELLEELTSIASQQLKEAEKIIKKVKKQERLDRKRFELQLLEFGLRNYCLLERLNSSERLKERLLLEEVLDKNQFEVVNEFLTKINWSDKGDWKHCSEHFLGLYESVSKQPEVSITEEKKIQNLDLMITLNKLMSVEWLWVDETEKRPLNFEVMEIKSEKSIDEDTDQSKTEQAIEEITPKEDFTTPSQKMQAENPKINFVFLHDSMVQPHGSNIDNENSHLRFLREPEAKSISQTSGANSNQKWQSTEANVTTTNLADVFSSATQSEFMHTDNAWTKNPKMPLNDRFRSRPVVPALGKEEEESCDNGWKMDRAAFNSDSSRFPKAARGRGRGRSNARFDNRQPANPLNS